MTTLRLFRPDDLPALVEIANTAADVDAGDEHFDLDTLREEFESKNDPERDCFVAVLPDGRLAGYAYVEQRHDEDRVWGYGWGVVHPDLRRQGIGTALLRAADARFVEHLEAVEVGERVIFIHRFLKASVPGAIALAVAAGYTLHRSSYRFRCALDRPLAPADPPPGFVFQPFDRARDAQAVYEVDQAAFMDGGGQPLRMSYEYWVQHYLERKEYDPALWIVLVDETTGQPVGAAITFSWGPDDPSLAWINRVGVLRAYRGRGLAKALLRQSLYASQQRGFTRAALGVRADNPSALKAYTSVGMEKYATFTHYRKVLRGDPAAIES